MLIVEDSLIRFTLYSRSYCHLCDDMLHALQAFADHYTFSVDVVDVDADPALLDLYDELVPVLVGVKDGQSPIRLCHYFLDVPKVEHFFAE